MTHATLMKDPFTYTADEGGGRVLQRFGSPVMYDDVGSKTDVVRNFGAATADRISSTDGVHNVWYQRYSSGRETVTMFANGVEADDYSHVFEFDLNFVQDGVHNVWYQRYSSGRE